LACHSELRSLVGKLVSLDAGLSQRPPIKTVVEKGAYDASLVAWDAGIGLSDPLSVTWLAKCGCIHDPDQPEPKGLNAKAQRREDAKSS